jgi:ferredoxin
MARSHQITINGKSFPARRGELLLDAALNNGIDLPYDCRAGHCGTCCVRLVSGEVRGGEGSEPGIVHACQCRIIGDVAVETRQSLDVRTVQGVLKSLRPLTSEVMEVGIRTNGALPYLPGQYATDFLPNLLPNDVLYVCGAPGMVDSVKMIAARAGATCYADPFLPSNDDKVAESVLIRATGWLAETSRQIGRIALDRNRNRPQRPIQAYRAAEASVRSEYRSERA